MNKYLKIFIGKKFKKTGKALDLGAGDFSDIKSLDKLGWECEGVDLNKGVNLEKSYISKNNPFDLVYSNYVFHKIKNKKQFIQIIYKNLKNNGWFFIHTFDESDPISSYGISSNFLGKILDRQGFKNIKIKIFDHYDNDHEHWHRILEAIGQK